MSEIHECSHPGCQRAATHILDLKDYCEEHYYEALDAQSDKESDDEVPSLPAKMINSALAEIEKGKICEKTGCKRPATHEFEGKNFCGRHYAGAMNRKRLKGKKYPEGYQDGLYRLTISRVGDRQNVFCVNVPSTFARDIIDEAMGLRRQSNER